VCFVVPPPDEVTFPHPIRPCDRVKGLLFGVRGGLFVKRVEKEGVECKRNCRGLHKERPNNFAGFVARGSSPFLQSTVFDAAADITAQECCSRECVGPYEVDSRGSRCPRCGGVVSAQGETNKKEVREGRNRNCSESK
jgi:hypothetical protein